MFRLLLTVVWIGIAGTALTAGLGYYVTPFGQRPFSEGHDLFAPTGLIGQGHGVIGTLMITTGVCLYSVRKRWVRLSQVGDLQHWLEFHIFLCTLGAFLVVLHTTFKVRGLVSISFWSMIVVLLSGFFGRYVYVWIPRTVNGRQRSAESVREERDHLVRTLRKAGLGAADLDTLEDRERPAPGELGPLGALVHSVRFRFRRRGEHHRLDARLNASGVADDVRDSVLETARKQDRLSEQLVLLPSFQRMLRYWHAFHLPLAILMFAVLGVHIAVAIAFGYTWIF